MICGVECGGCGVGRKMTASGGYHESHSSRLTHPVHPAPRHSITLPPPHRRTTQAAVRSHNHKLGSTRAGASGKGPPNAAMKSGGGKGGKAAAPVSDGSAPWPVATRETTYSHLNALVRLSPPPSPAPAPGPPPPTSPLARLCCLSPPLLRSLLQPCLLSLTLARSLALTRSLPSSRPSLRCPSSLRYQTSSNTACT
jgi:hypothetical protein